MQVKVQPKTAESYFKVTVDGAKKDDGLFPVEILKEYTAEESFRLRYHKDQAGNIRLTVNGKELALPTAPRGNVEIELNKANLAQALQSGQAPAMGAQTTANANAANMAR
jgi:hypothetical protein